MSVSKFDATIWDKVARRLLEKDTIRVELERLLGDDPTAADVKAIENSISDIQRKKQRAAKNLTLFENEEDAAPLVRELEALSAHERSLTAERDLLLSRRENWEAARRQIDSLEAWCKQVADNLDSLDYEGRRDALRAFGINVTFYRKGHEPRYEIRSTIPLEVSSEALS